MSILIQREINIRPSEQASKGSLERRTSVQNPVSSVHSMSMVRLPAPVTRSASRVQSRPVHCPIPLPLGLLERSPESSPGWKWQSFSAGKMDEQKYLCYGWKAKLIIFRHMSWPFSGYSGFVFGGPAASCCGFKVLFFRLNLLFE